MPKRSAKPTSMKITRKSDAKRTSMNKRNKITSPTPRFKKTTTTRFKGKKK